MRKCSAKPSKEIYQASCVDAILTFLLGLEGTVYPTATESNSTTPQTKKNLVSTKTFHKLGA